MSKVFAADYIYEIQGGMSIAFGLWGFIYPLSADAVTGKTIGTDFHSDEKEKESIVIPRPFRELEKYNFLIPEKVVKDTGDNNE